MADTYSVIIPTYNRLETLKLVLDALGRQDAPELLGEVVVVDDGSQDGTAAWVREAELPYPTVVLEGRRGGPAAARNAGIEVASGRWALFLCDDIEATPGLLRAHHEARGDDPSCAVQGRVDWPPGTEVTHFMRFAIKHYHWHFDDFTDLQDLPARHFITSNASAELTTLRALSGFDLGFSYGYEDTDLGLRMEEAGVRLRYADRAVAYHHHGIDLYSYSRREEAVGKSGAYFAHKWPQHPTFTGVRKLPRPGSWRWLLKGAVRNRLNIRCWQWLALAADAVGLERLAEVMYFQVFSYFYYRGMAAGMVEMEKAQDG